MDGADTPVTAPLAPVAQSNDCTFRTTCPYCGVGCGVLATPDGQGGITVKGDPAHPANKGRLCSKGSSLAETVGLDGRLLHPVIDGARSTWDEALDLTAQKFRETIAEHGPDSVAFYVSGQLLTEDYYVANKLMKGFIGSANIDTNSRLCMASTVAGHRRAFGTDTVPGMYEDLEQADLIVLVGSNLAWCHPVLYQRVVAAKQDRPGMKVINIDPRRTATSDLADLHLMLEPGSDVALFNRLLVEIVDRGLVDEAFVSDSVDGFDKAVEAARADDAAVTGLSDEDLTAFLEMWTGTEKVVTVFSQGVNQSTSGSDKVNSILNCHLATGRIGKPGLGPFSVTGQPNAMGGREVGGLANMLACHLDIENAEHRAAVRKFWDAPAMPEAAGAKAVDMFQRVADGKIKALWVICTNPAVSMPDADAVRDAIAGCDFVVVSDMFATTDTAKLADVLLPATGWGEKDGTVTNSERCISRQRGLLPAPGEARHDWDILSDVGRRMGWTKEFDYQTPAEVFREYAALSGVAAGFGRDFDISALSDLEDADYDGLEPVRWPINAVRTGGRFFGDGKFFTDTGKAKMLPLTHRAPAAKTGPKYPFRFNTGRIRDQWHTMTRTALSGRLSQHLAEPFLEIHPEDAAELGLKPADLVTVESPQGRALLRALPTDRVGRKQVFAPMHWTSEYASAARIDALVRAEVDPVSGQPESKASVVKVTRFNAAWYGFAVSSRALNAKTSYWASARAGNGWRAELADMATPKDWEAYARELFNAPDAAAVTVFDHAKGTARIALTEEGRLVGALFAGKEPVAVSRNHLVGLIGGEAAIALAGRPGADMPDPGATLCSCFNIGVNTILTAIETDGLMSVEAIGAALGAGTNCGSCRPEIAALLESVRTKEAAE
ncbi:nitrate reductase [Actibacterium lipolyticum]|uniref:Nitrate reductase n=1 Tax=Actibacterium lipolyticum TaxID=1524263 RepID=A0A238JJ36_9RHOB|nr:nitrate reductase [Actibacterium lipolyticum]SMX30698.1 Nitrate reductase [Actibacterium lipolyticum]